MTADTTVWDILLTAAPAWLALISSFALAFERFTARPRFHIDTTWRWDLEGGSPSPSPDAIHVTVINSGRRSGTVIDIGLSDRRRGGGWFPAPTRRSELPLVIAAKSAHEFQVPLTNERPLPTWVYVVAVHKKRKRREPRHGQWQAIKPPDESDLIELLPADEA